MERFGYHLRLAQRHVVETFSNHYVKSDAKCLNKIECESTEYKVEDLAMSHVPFNSVLSVLAHVV